MSILQIEINTTDIKTRILSSLGFPAEGSKPETHWENIYFPVKKREREL